MLLVTSLTNICHILASLLESELTRMKTKNEFEYKHQRQENGRRIEIMTGDWISFRIDEGKGYGDWIKVKTYQDLEQLLRQYILHDWPIGCDLLAEMIMDDDGVVQEKYPPFIE